MPRKCRTLSQSFFFLAVMLKGRIKFYVRLDCDCKLSDRCLSTEDPSCWRLKCQEFTVPATRTAIITGKMDL